MAAARRTLHCTRLKFYFILVIIPTEYSIRLTNHIKITNDIKLEIFMQLLLKSFYLRVAKRGYKNAKENNGRPHLICPELPSCSDSANSFL